MPCTRFTISGLGIFCKIFETADKTARARGRKIHIVAESDLNDVRLLLPPAQGGYGIDAQWSDDFHHMAHVALTGERQGYYEDYVEMEQFPKLMEHTFVRDGCYSPRRGRSHGGGPMPDSQAIVSVFRTMIRSAIAPEANGWAH